MSKLLGIIKGFFRGEPVVTAEVIRILLAVSALFGLGWSEEAIGKMTSALILVVSMVISVLARRATTPNVNPQPKMAPQLVPGDVEAGEPFSKVELQPVIKPVLTLKGWRLP